MEVPQIERKRAGLAYDLRLWMVLAEYNHDILETAFHIDPNGRCGSFSPMFAHKVLDAFIDAGAQGAHKEGSTQRMSRSRRFARFGSAVQQESAVLVLKDRAEDTRRVRFPRIGSSSTRNAVIKVKVEGMHSHGTRLLHRRAPMCIRNWREVAHA